MSPTFTPQKVVYFVELFPYFSVDSSDNFIISNKNKPFKIYVLHEGQYPALYLNITPPGLSLEPILRIQL